MITYTNINDEIKDKKLLAIVLIYFYSKRGSFKAHVPFRKLILSKKYFVLILKFIN